MWAVQTIKYWFLKVEKVGRFVLCIYQNTILNLNTSSICFISKYRIPLKINLPLIFASTNYTKSMTLIMNQEGYDDYSESQNFDQIKVRFERPQGANQACVT